MSIDLEDFQTRIQLRELTLGDYDAVVAIQLRCFPGMKPWSRAQFESQLSVFPEGQLGIEVDGRLVASSAALIVDSSEYSEWHNWYELADHGFIRSIYLRDPNGYVVELAARTDRHDIVLNPRRNGARAVLAEWQRDKLALTPAG